MSIRVIGPIPSLSAHGGKPTLTLPLVLGAKGALKAIAGALGLLCQSYVSSTIIMVLVLA